MQVRRGAATGCRADAGSRMAVVRATERTHYQVLGVSPTASTVEIRTAHRRLAQLLHPDRQSAATPAERRLAERRMREVNVAWTTLSDPIRRAEYDRSRPGATPGPFAPTRPAPTGDAAVAKENETVSAAWWDSDDPAAAFARMHAKGEDDIDDGTGDDYPIAGTWFLRRGPVVVVLLVGLVLFVVTAYAGRGASRSTATTMAPSAVAGSRCVKLMPDHMAYAVACDGRHDATIVRDEPYAQACIRDGLDYAVIASRSVCIDRV